MAPFALTLTGKACVGLSVWRRCVPRHCTYTTSRLESVRRHERRHTAEFPVVCLFPGCKFRWVRVCMRV